MKLMSTPFASGYRFIRPGIEVVLMPMKNGGFEVRVNGHSICGGDFNASRVGALETIREVSPDNHETAKSILNWEEFQVDFFNPEDQ